MKSYIGVESSIYPELNILSDTVRVPSNIKEENRKDINSEALYKIYVYDENVYTMAEYTKVLSDRINQTEIALMSVLIKG